MGETQISNFSKWRSLLWPIHRTELRKFLPIFFICFLISFNYNALRTYKDAIVITANHAGAEIIPFIKLWAVLPAAILFTCLYTRLSNRFRQEKVFYITMSIFLSFFFIFTFFLYPARDFLHPHGVADYLQSHLPLGCKGLIAIFRNWTFTLFYVMSELWSTAVLTVLFWGFANTVITVSEAKRFYGILCAAANIAGCIAGGIAVVFSQNTFISWIPYGKTPWDQSIFLFTLAILFCGGLATYLFRWVHKNVFVGEGAVPSLDVPPSEKPKMSFRQSLLYLSKSKYLILIATIVLMYHVAINMTEVIWKDQLQALYPNPSDYAIFTGHMTIAISALATFAGFFSVSNCMRRFSWTACALVSPMVVGITGSAFFIALLIKYYGITWIYGISPLMLGVFLGSIQNCLSRASKYTFFDATKEISFIPLETDLKVKGKAAIDGVGSRLGKSASGAIYSILLIFFSSLSSSTPYIAVIFLGVVLVWGASVFALGKRFDQLQGVATEKEKSTDAAATASTVSN